MVIRSCSVATTIRGRLFSAYVSKLAEERPEEQAGSNYTLVERLAPEIIGEKA